MQSKTITFYENNMISACAKTKKIIVFPIKQTSKNVFISSKQHLLHKKIENLIRGRK